MPRKENIFANQAVLVIKKSDPYDDSKNDEAIDAIQDWFEAEMEIDSELDTLDALDVNEKFFSFAQEQD